MNGHEITIAGLKIGSNLPIFLVVLGVHVLAGLVSVVSGLIAMLSPKRTGRHPAWGTIYYQGLLVVFLTAAILSLIRWPYDNYLLILGTACFLIASLGRIAPRRRWPGWVQVHIPSMGISYILLLTAFYVDNGPSLPLWKDLPPIAYWLVPFAVGIPLIVRSLWQYRPSRTRLYP